MLLLLAAASAAQAEGATARTETALPTLAPIVKRILPSIVAVSSVKQARENQLQIDPRDGFPDLPVPQRVSGSGVIADADHGLIVTAYHLVERSRGVTVTLVGGREVGAKVLATSPGDDLAVLGIEPGPFTPIELGRADDLQVGDFVLAIGNPLKAGKARPSASSSGLHRSGPGTDNSDLIATDALIAQGNSGGALVNLRGELVGVNIIRLGSGFAFAVPVAAVLRLLAGVRLDG